MKRFSTTPFVPKVGVNQGSPLSPRVGDGEGSLLLVRQQPKVEESSSTPFRPKVGVNRVRGSPFIPKVRVNRKTRKNVTKNMVFSRRPFTRSQVREAREATLKDDNFGSQHLDMDYPITLTDDSFPMDPPAVDMANPTDDNFDVDSDSPAALLPVCPCGSVEAFHYCYSGMPDFVGPNAGAWAQSNPVQKNNVDNNKLKWLKDRAAEKVQQWGLRAKVHVEKIQALAEIRDEAQSTGAGQSH
nr:uncharacterized protein LOC109403790 [Aedes albopictus]